MHTHARPHAQVLLQVDEFDCGDNTRTADQDGDCVCNAGNGYPYRMCSLVKCVLL